MAKSHYSDRRIAQELTRLKAKEVKLLDGVPERHELWTCHPAGRAKRSLLQTHASGEENYIWVAPFTTNGTFMRVRKISATVGTPKCRTTATEDGWALWLYRYTIAPKGIKKEDPLLLPQGELASMLDVTDIAKRLYYPLTLDNLQEQKMFRLDLILRRDILLKPTEFYAIGFQSRTADSYWYCPVDSGTHYGAVAQGARRTYPVSGGHTFGTFPENLKMQMDGPYDEIFVDMPAICIRSAAGVHALEPPVSVNESLALQGDDDVPAAYACISISDNTATTITAGGTLQKLSNGTTLLQSKSMSMPSSNRIQYDGSVTRTFIFQIAVSIEVSSTGTATDPNDPIVAIAKNGTELGSTSGLQSRQRTDGKDTWHGNQTVIGMISLDPGDYVEIFVTSNATSDQILAEDGQFNVWSIT